MKRLHAIVWFHTGRDCDAESRAKMLPGDCAGADFDSVLGYISEAPIVAVVPGVQCDVLNPARVAGAPHIRSDGLWVWPDTLSYYVRKYRLCLPADFIAFLRSRSFLRPASISVESADIEAALDAIEWP